MGKKKKKNYLAYVVYIVSIAKDVAFVLIELYKLLAE